MHKPNGTISESEWQVMKVLWKKAPQALPEITEALSAFEWSITTIQTYLSRLTKKGILKTERRGKGYLYTPTVTEEYCQLSESAQFLNRVYNGSVASMISGFVKSGTLSDDEMRTLKSLIEEHERNHADNR